MYMPREVIDVRDSESDLKQLVSDILAEAARQGASAAEVSVNEDVGLGVTVRKGELETVEFNQDRGFGITVYYGLRKGSASTSDSSAGAIAETVGAARNIAKFTEEDPCSGLADPALMPTELPDLDLYHPWQLSADAAQELAVQCEAAGLGHDQRIVNSDGTQVSTQQSCRVYGNSHGFIGSFVGTRHSMSCVLIAEDASGMQRDYWYTLARDPADLESPDHVGVEAARRTAARLSPRKPATGRFPILFSPQMASGLIGHLIGAISGGALYRKASFLMDSLGEQVMSPHITLHETPLVPGWLGSASFDGEGVATQAKDFVRHGVVENYVLGSYSARKLNMHTTGNAGGVFNLQVEGTTRSVDAMLGDLDQGLLVTELMGQGVNSVTGDYSRGAAGFWVEGGEIAYPVDEVTIASNLRDVLCDIQCLGDDVDERANIRAPSLLVGAMTVASQ
jgi:PmbA protein